MQISLAFVNNLSYICQEKLNNPMIQIYSEEQWNVLGNMFGAVSKLANALEEKGFKVIASLSVGIYPASVTFIVERNTAKIFSFCSLDILKEEERLKAELFNKGEELLQTDLVAVEREFLLRRLEELNHPSNGR